jgi:hypothetical protein
MGWAPPHSAVITHQPSVIIQQPHKIEGAQPHQSRRGNDGGARGYVGQVGSGTSSRSSAAVGRGPGAARPGYERVRLLPGGSDPGLDLGSGQPPTSAARGNAVHPESRTARRQCRPGKAATGRQPSPPLRPHPQPRLGPQQLAAARHEAGGEGGGVAWCTAHCRRRVLTGANTPERGRPGQSGPRALRAPRGSCSAARRGRRRGRRAPSCRAPAGACP